MKISAVEAIVLRLPSVTTAADGTQDTCLIRVDTDAGITGWGEVDSAPTVVKAIVDAPLSHQLANGLANALRGADPLDRAGCRERMDKAVNFYGRVGVGVHAMAGIDVALWDIAGKSAGKSVSDLFGAAPSQRIRAYASLLFGDTPAETGERARRFADAGFSAIKFGWGPMGRSAREDLELVREASLGAGKHVTVLVDAGQVWDWETALKRAEAFTEFNIGFLEEPLAPDDLTGYRRLSERSPLPIATGEAESQVPAFQRLLECGVNYVQPDPGRCGITTMVEVGRRAHEYGAGTINHTFKSGISIAASLHALAAIGGGEFFEYCVVDSPLRHEVTAERFPVIDGLLAVPAGPGLGITVVDETIERYRVA
ncbi:MAG: mandelate racemase/muconate lactonizing enzyme family protein [Chloroflexota bacterium]|jgi:L-alanine-DL-glutamate epimerase-like enolase superfamily enzyme|nr:mandelate racemase/muconate lactonizing enzyme family protein [Chloroflexota bacterium]